MKKFYLAGLVMLSMFGCRPQYEVICSKSIVGYNYIAVDIKNERRAIKLENHYSTGGGERDGLTIIVPCNVDLRYFKNSEIKNYKLIQ